MLDRGRGARSGEWPGCAGLEAGRYIPLGAPRRCCDGKSQRLGKTFVERKREVGERERTAKWGTSMANMADPRGRTWSELAGWHGHKFTKDTSRKQDFENITFTTLKPLHTLNNWTHIGLFDFISPWSRPNQIFFCSDFEYLGWHKLAFYTSGIFCAWVCSRLHLLI